MLAMGLSLYRTPWAEDKKTIKQIMKEAHVGGNNSLMFKIAGGKGTKEDAEKLVALYKDLSENTPPRGEEKDSTTGRPRSKSSSESFRWPSLRERPTPVPAAQSARA